jgi:drug/metabolite transporter (DMT)-like permease
MVIATEASRARTRAALLTVQLLFGVNYLVSKQVLAVIDAPAWAALRAGSAFVILAAVAILGRRRLPPVRDVLGLAVCALFGVALNQVLFLEGLARTTPAHSALICSQIPLFALVAAVALRYEPLTLRKAFGLMVGMAGVMVLLEVDRFRLDDATVVGDLLTLANTASYGLFVVLSGRLMQRNDPLAASAIVFGFGTAAILLYGGDDLARVDLGALAATTWWQMAFAVVGATVVPYFLNLWALKHTQASRVAIYVFLQPVVATVLAVALRDDPVTWRLLVAGALVFASLALREAPGRRATGTAP